MDSCVCDGRAEVEHIHIDMNQMVMKPMLLNG